MKHQPQPRSPNEDPSSFIEIHDTDDGRVWALDERGHVFTYDHDSGLWNETLNPRERETLVPT